MNSDNNKKNSLTANFILLIAVIGVIYFGYMVVTNRDDARRENPFEYNIENFKKTDSGMVNYKQVQQIKLEFENAYAIALDSRNRLFVSGDQSIDILDLKGTLINRISIDQPATALAVDQHGQIIAAINNSIHIYKETAETVNSWEIPLPKPIITSVAVHHTGIYVADAENRTIFKFNWNGKLLFRIGPEKKTSGVPEFVIPSPYFDVAVDPDGFMWVANTGNHSVENYTPSGEYRTAWGTYSMDIEGFCGCCNPSHLAILNDGSFVTSEKGIPRIKIYDRLGQLESIVAGAEQFDDDTVGLDLAVDSSNRIFVLNPKNNVVLVYQKKTNAKF